MLADYTCARCFTHPFEEKELFYGCTICGNTNFRVEPSLDQKLNYFCNLIKNNRSFENIESIKVLETGSYQVDVDKLFKDSKLSFFSNNFL